MKKDNSLMSGQGEKGEWKTINGTHIFIEDGQSVEEAINKKFSNSILSKKTINEEKYSWTNVNTIKQAKRIDSDIVEKKLAHNLLFKYGSLNMTTDEIVRKVDGLLNVTESYDADKVRQYIRQNRNLGNKIFSSYKELSESFKLD